MTPDDRHEQARRLSERYRRASRAEKATILDAFCTATGLNRKYAISLLREPPEESRRSRRRPGRRKKYSEAALDALETIWVAADFPWSVRLKAMLPIWLGHLKQLAAEVKKELLEMSPRSMDRYLRERRTASRRKLYGRTKPGTLLKHHIPIRTDRWDVSEPGWCEIDLVSHSGPCADGEFAHSLNFTDIHSTWTETRAVFSKAQEGIVEAIESIRTALPFRLRGIDSDNGSEFINGHLYRYCTRQKVQFTRGRPYKKDDNAHIEQKNWTHVRRLVGWERIDDRAAVDALNALYANEWRLMMNLFQPSVKLLHKERIGSRTRRVYDAPTTPLDRLLAGGFHSPELDRLVALRSRLNPFELSDIIERKLAVVHRLNGKRRTRANPSEPSHPLLNPPPQGGGRHRPEMRHDSV